MNAPILRCECGASWVQSSGDITFTYLRCGSCPKPKYPPQVRSWFQLVEWVDEWCHGHFPNWLGGRCHYLYRPLCNYRERRYMGLDSAGTP